MAFTVDSPPAVSTGPRLKIASIGPIPLSPSVWLRSSRVCSAPHRQDAGSSPSVCVSSSTAAAMAACRVSSRVCTPSTVLSSHQKSSGESQMFSTTCQ